MSNQSELFELAKQFAPSGMPVSAVRFGEGHINDTFRISFSEGSSDIILQKINTGIFKEPVRLMENVVLITEFLKDKINKAGGDTARETLSVIRTCGDKSYFIDDNGGFWRSFDFIHGTKGYEQVENANQMYSSGKAFGHFQKMLSDFPADKLFEIIPDFHNTPSRFETFKKSLEADALGRAKSAEYEIRFILEREKEFGKIQTLLNSGEMPLRVTHNDTKLNNVLIDIKTEKAVCVIDLDTVMPGSTLYDYGDGIRSAANSAAEDETDLSKVILNKEYFEKYTEGYLSEAKEFLTPIELKNMAFSVRLIAYELGMRFLTDHLNGDTYFKIHRENHNLERSRVQLRFAADMENKAEYMENTVSSYI